MKKKDNRFMSEAEEVRSDCPPQCKILIVEDEQISRHLLEGLIRDFDADIEITAVDSASKGLYHYFKNNFHLVFLDIVMASVDGNDFVAIVEENMKAGLLKSNPNIIVQTAMASAFKLSLLAEKVCVLEVIKKPITKEKIQESLVRYLGERGRKCKLSVHPREDGSCPRMKIRN